MVDLKTAKKIAVLNFITTTVGDSLYLLPVLQKLRKEVPQAEIILTGSAVTKAVLGDEPSIKEYITLPTEPLAQPLSKWQKAKAVARVMKTAIRELRKRKPDVALVFLPNFWPYQLIPLLAGVPFRAGFTYPGSRFSRTLHVKTPFRDFLTTRDIDVHLSDANLDLLRAFGIAVTHDDALLRRNVSAAEISAGGKKLADIKAREKLIAFQVGAKYKNRQWPTERFAAVGKALVAEGYDIILLGSPGEIAICDEVAKGIGARAFNLAGKLDFGAMAGVLKRCALAVGNDSGLMHLAASVGVMTVSLFGTSHPKHTKPWGVAGGVVVLPTMWNDKALFEPEDKDTVSPYVLGISTEKVILACRETLKNGPKREIYQ